MDVFNGVTNETIIFTIVLFVGINISMIIAYRDGYKSGKQIGMHDGYTKRFIEERDFYRDKPPPPPPRNTKPSITKLEPKPPEGPEPVIGRRR